VYRHHPEHTVQPPGRDDAGALPAVAALRADGGPCRLVGPDGTAVVLPAELVEVLAVAAAGLASGCAVTLTRHEQTVSTQEAADLLGISRPTLVRLLDHGVLPYDQPGSHRRLLLRDVLTFRADRHHDLPAPPD
jgi:excisionase family DNA binding protein